MWDGIDAASLREVQTATGEAVAVVEMKVVVPMQVAGVEESMATVFGRDQSRPSPCGTDWNSLKCN